MINKYTSKLYCLILLLGVSIQILAQEQNIIPASPEANALAKSINFPVGYNTGVPDINIPLYEIKTPGGLNLPVTLNYHAGGFRINEKSTSVGLGWSLSTSLQVSRSVNGKDDLSSGGSDYGGYYYRDYFGPDSHPNTGKNYIEILKNMVDEQPDAFNYKLLNKSGTFYFHKAQGQPTRAITIPYTGVDIQLIANDCFKITDTDGTVYWFGRNDENSSSITAIERTTHDSESFVSAWKCVAIVSPSKVDVMQFEYSQRGHQHNYILQDRIEVLDGDCRGGGATYPPANIGLHKNGQGIYYPYEGNSINVYYPVGGTDPLLGQASLFNISSPKYFNYSIGADEGLHVIWKKPDQQLLEDTRYSIKPPNNDLTEPQNDVEDLQLSKITFRGGELRYNLVGGIVSLPGYQTSIAKLQSIDVYSNNNTLVKTIAFLQSDATGCNINSHPWQFSAATSYLDGLKISKNSTGPAENYAFNYRSKYCFNNLKGSDSWGGVNASTKAHTSESAVPLQLVEGTHYIGNRCDNQTTLGYFIGNGDKLVDANLVQSGILTAITYPSGGITEFVFGSNKYNYDSNLHIAGGLRIEKIKYYDGKSPQPVSQKIYRYGKGEDQAGIVISIPSIETADYGGYKYSQMQFYGEYTGTAAPYNWYPQVSQNKTTYTSDSFLDLYYSSGSPVSYVEVAEYQADKGMSTGKTIYNYDEGSYFGYSPAGTVAGTNLTMRRSDWDLGKLTSETRFKYQNGSYDAVRQKIYSYTPLVKESVSVGKVFQNNEYMTYDGLSVPDEIYYPEDFTYVNYPLTSGVMLLYQEREIFMDGSGQLTKSTSYQYGTALQVKQRIVTDGSGTAVITNTTFPEDYAPGTAFIDNLKSNHMVNKPIETTVTGWGTTGEKLISGEVNTYRSDNTGLADKSYQLEAPDLLLSAFQPSNTSGFNPDVHYKEKATYTYDELDNLASIQIKDNIATSYHWDYVDKTYPVAECKNAMANEFYYNGFNNSYQSGDYQLIFTPPTARAYVYAYRYLESGTWHYSGEQTYFSSVWLTAGDAIDDVRVYPKDAELTTYTYDPLVGMTSATDAKGRITFYEYDDLGRLKNIKDQNGNIVKNYCYNYAGQLSDCNIPVAPFSNELKSAFFYKNDCPEGEGPPINYMVPAGMYTSSISVEDANAKAEADILANGQNYANIEGDCPIATTNEEIIADFLYSNTYYTLDGQYRGTVIAYFSDLQGNLISVTNLDFVYYKYMSDIYNNSTLLSTYTLDNVNGYSVLISYDELLNEIGATLDDNVNYYFRSWLE